VVWASEFRRLSIAQPPEDRDYRKAGRRHNTNASCA
jgi:hypothetical protein